MSNGLPDDLVQQFLDVTTAIGKHVRDRAISEGCTCGDAQEHKCSGPLLAGDVAALAAILVMGLMVEKSKMELSMVGIFLTTGLNDPAGVAQRVPEVSMFARCAKVMKDLEAYSKHLKDTASVKPVDNAPSASDLIEKARAGG